jgi:hypothetical protein
MLKVSPVSGEQLDKVDCDAPSKKVEPETKC